MVITHVIAIINFTDLNMNFKPDFLALKKNELQTEFYNLWAL